MPAAIQGARSRTHPPNRSANEHANTGWSGKATSRSVSPSLKDWSWTGLSMTQASFFSAATSPGSTLRAADDERLFRHACALGLDGIVSKRIDKSYVSGRCWSWVKVKNPDCPRPSGHVVSLLRRHEVGPKQHYDGRCPASRIASLTIDLSRYSLPAIRDPGTMAMRSWWIALRLRCLLACVGAASLAAAIVLATATSSR